MNNRKTIIGATIAATVTALGLAGLWIDAKPEAPAVTTSPHADHVVSFGWRYIQAGDHPLAAVYELASSSREVLLPADVDRKVFDVVAKWSRSALFVNRVVFARDKLNRAAVYVGGDRIRATTDPDLPKDVREAVRAIDQATWRAVRDDFAKRRIEAEPKTLPDYAP